MKELTLETSNWRTVQVFLSPTLTGIFEVEADVDNGRVRCNCPTYRSRVACKHTRFVKKRIDENDGHYSVVVPSFIADEDIEKASETPEGFREFVVRWGKVEVL